MCCPAQFDGVSHNTSWSLWFVLELRDYYHRTGDKALIEKAKDKVYRLLTYFAELTNEYGLLENVKELLIGYGGPVNDEEYLAGVNFPTNMLFSEVLSCVAELYCDTEKQAQAQALRKTIVEFSYTGEFFTDNAIRKNGGLFRCDEHISEICQNYAVFFAFTPNEEYLRRIVDNFGPLRDVEKVYPQIQKADMFNGHCLRFMWLTEMGEYQRVLKEAVEYLYPQARQTGTLWEFDTPRNSCSHGYPTIVASLLTKCIKEIKKHG